MALFDSLVLSTLPWVPRPIMRRLSARYIAGEDLDEAVLTVADLNQRGFEGILNILGEHVLTEDQAEDVVGQFQAAAKAVAQRKLQSTISVKPTHLGLEKSEELALEGYRAVTKSCAEHGLFLRVEMEDHPTTEATLRIFENLRADFDNVGIVLQSRLLRTPADIDQLLKSSDPKGLNVRMVKGIYLEPAKVAHTEAAAIAKAYVACTHQLLSAGAFVALATHDSIMAEAVLKGLQPEQKDRYEFQVLMGVQEKLWSDWQSRGHKVRVYVPYGEDWREYSLRRMRKNPEILRHVMRNFFGRG